MTSTFLAICLTLFFKQMPANPILNEHSDTFPFQSNGFTEQNLMLTATWVWYDVLRSQHLCDFCVVWVPSEDLKLLIILDNATNRIPTWNWNSPAHYSGLPLCVPRVYAHFFMAPSLLQAIKLHGIK